MELRNCSRCGKVFMFVSKRICPECQREMDHLFENVRQYVKANPGATVMEIAEALEMDEQLVNEFVREGRFDVVAEAVSISCERCGKPIRRGRLCEACVASLTQEIKGAMPVRKPEEPVSARGADRQKLYLADHITKDKGR
jgi:flagellar operon protein (TIGR03826 family)